MKHINIKTHDKVLTLRDSISFKKYLSEVANTSPLSVSEEVELFEQFKNGSELARNKIIKSNLRFVLSCAKFHINRGVSYEDLVSEGNYGLTKAIDRFDITKGFKFISYAVWWIQQAMLNCIYNNSKTVRVPTGKYSLLIKIDKYKLEFIQKNHRIPTTFEISENLNVSNKVIESAINSYSNTTALDAKHPITNLSLLDIIPGKSVLKCNDNSDNLKLLMPKILDKCLKLAERDVISCLYGLNIDRELSVNETCVKLDLTETQVRNKKNMALEKMRSYLKRHKNFKKSLF